MLSALYTLLNRLLPFATAGTPLAQDLVHLGVVCTLLYFAPQIQTYINDRRHAQSEAQTTRIEHDRREVVDDTAQHDDGIPPVAVPVVEHVEEPELDQHEDQDLDDGDEGEIRVGDAGPADDVPNTARNRQIGAKKAKSMARRDQRRAYHEFMRSQSEMQKARDNEGKEEREAALAAERARRAEAEAAVREKERQEREDRRNREAQSREEERRRREIAVKLVRDRVEDRGWADLQEVANQVGKDLAWMEALVRAGGLLKEVRGEEVVLMTESKTVVRVRRKDLDHAWRLLATTQSDGRLSYDQVGSMLERVVKSRVAV